MKASATRQISQLLLFGFAVCFGITIGYIGSRPHFDDTGVQAGLLVLSAGLLGALGPDRPWLWALGIGLWTPVANWLVAHPPDPRSKPLPLPWGMTSTAPAQAIVGAAIILLFPLAGAYAGMLFRRMVSAGLD